RVVIIDDDKLSAHNLGVKLRFVGEEHVLLTSAGCRQWFAEQAQRDSVYAILVGTLNGTPPARIVAGLRELGLALPVVLCGDPAQLETFAPEDRSRVLAALRRPLPYEALTEALDQARRQAGLGG